jgi:hypothetical protein
LIYINDRRAASRLLKPGRTLNLLESSIIPLLHLVAGVVLTVGISLAAAAPVVPSSAMPGRERERFTESPIERFMQPSPPVSPQVTRPANRKCPKPLGARKGGCPK